MLLAGCSSSQSELTPEETVKAYFNALQKLDIEKLQDLSTTNHFDESLLEDDDTIDPKQFFKKVSCKIKGDAKIDGDTATVETEVTTIDVKALLANVMQYALSLALLDEEADAEEAINSKMAEEFSKEDVPTTSSTVNIQLKKSDEGWKVETNEDLQNAIFGGFMDIANEMGF